MPGNCQGPGGSAARLLRIGDAGVALLGAVKSILAAVGGCSSACRGRGGIIAAQRRMAGALRWPRVTAETLHVFLPPHPRVNMLGVGFEQFCLRAIKHIELLGAFERFRALKDAIGLDFTGAVFRIDDQFLGDAGIYRMIPASQRDFPGGTDYRGHRAFEFAREHLGHEFYRKHFGTLQRVARRGAAEKGRKQ